MVEEVVVMIAALKALRGFLRAASIDPRCVRVIIEVDYSKVAVFRHAVAKEWEEMRRDPPDMAPVQIPNMGNVLGVRYEVRERTSTKRDAAYRRIPDEMF